MNRFCRWLLASILWILSSVAVAVGAPDVDYYSEENVLCFADYLYEEGDYHRAAAEYQRYLIFSSTLKDSILYKIGLCYQLAAEHKRAIYFFRKTARLPPQTDLLTSVYIQTAYSYLAIEDFDLSDQLLSSVLSTDHSQVDGERLLCMQGFSYLLQKKWGSVSALLHSPSAHYNDDNPNSCLAKLKKAQQEGMSLPHRSPLLSGIFSAIIPGAGKMYCGRYVDALMSFVLVGTATWQSSKGFRERGSRSQRGWAYATLGGILWVGNIYGSMVSARIYNREYEEDFLTKIRLELRF